MSLQEKEAHEECTCKVTVRRQPSANQGEKPEINPAGNFISGFQFPGLSENKFLLFKSPSLWYSVMTAELTDVPVVTLSHSINVNHLYSFLELRSSHLCVSFPH